MSKAWENRSGGSYYRYRKQRAQIMEHNRISNQGRCTLAIDGVCTGTATEIHHTKGIKVTGHDPRFMVPVCKPCNLAIGEPIKSTDPSGGAGPSWMQL